MDKKQLKKLAPIILLILGLVLSVYLVSQRTNLFSKAAPPSAPEELRISNISDNSFTVSWVTPQKSTLGLVSFGIKGASGSAGLDDRDIGGPKPRFTHHVTLKNLTPSTTYLFTVSSGGEIYQNNGEPFQQTTAPTTEAPPAVPEPVFGQVNKNDGTVLQEGLIYLAIGKNSLLSTYIDAGRWLITLNNARTQDLQNYIVPEDSDKALLFVQAGMDGTSKIENIVANLRPVPILLQNTQDLPNIGLIKANLGKKGKGVVGDLNGDGVVNVVDFAIAVKKQLNLP